MRAPWLMHPPTSAPQCGPGSEPLTLPSPPQTYFLPGTELAPCLSPNGLLLCLENPFLFYLKSRTVPSSPLVMRKHSVEFGILSF